MEGNDDDAMDGVDFTSEEMLLTDEQLQKPASEFVTAIDCARISIITNDNDLCSQLGSA